MFRILKEPLFGLFELGAFVRMFIFVSANWKEAHILRACFD